MEQEQPQGEIQPIKPSNKKKETPICFRLDDELLARLTECEVKKNMNRSQVVRELIERGLIGY